MRTTLDLDKPILEALKKRGKREGLTLSRLASRLLAEALAHDKKPGTKETNFSWVAAQMEAKVDISDKVALYQTLDKP